MLSEAVNKRMIIIRPFNLPPGISFVPNLCTRVKDFQGQEYLLFNAYSYCFISYMYKIDWPFSAEVLHSVIIHILRLKSFN